MLWPDAWIIEACRDRMCVNDLAIVILQKIGAIAMQHARTATCQGCGMETRFNAMTGGFDAKNRDTFVFKEWMKQANGVRAPANTCHQGIGQTAFAFEHLLLGFPANHRLEVTNQLGIGMRASDRANDVERIRHIGNPVAQGFIHGIF